jgi:hypothetical protein
MLDPHIFDNIKKALGFLGQNFRLWDIYFVVELLPRHERNFLLQQRALSSCFPALPQPKMIWSLRDGFCLGNDRQRTMQNP